MGPATVGNDSASPVVQGQGEGESPYDSLTRMEIDIINKAGVPVRLSINDHPLQSIPANPVSVNVKLSMSKMWNMTIIAVSSENGEKLLLNEKPYVTVTLKHPINSITITKPGNF